MSELFENVLREEYLQEKALFGSLDSQIKKASKQIEASLKEFDAVIPKIKSNTEQLLAPFGGNAVFNQPILNFSSEALKAVVTAKASVELGIGLECVKKELEEAQKILTDQSYLDFAKQIDDNTGLFGGDKGKFTTTDKNGNKSGVTSKNTKIVDKNQKGNFDAKTAHQNAANLEEATLKEFLGFGKKEKQEPIDITKGMEQFKASSQKLSQALANAAQINELLQKDPEMQKAAQAANVNFNKVAGAVAITGGILKLVGTVVPGVGAVGTLLASGAVLAKSGNSIIKTATNKNLSISQKVLRMAPAVAGAAFAAIGMKNAVGQLSQQFGGNETADIPTQEPQQAAPAEQPQEVQPNVNNTLQAQANAQPGDVLQRADGTKVVLNKGDIEWAKNKIAASERQIVAENPQVNEVTPQIEQQVETTPATEVADNPVNTEPAMTEDQLAQSNAVNEPSNEQINNALKNGFSSTGTYSTISNGKIDLSTLQSDERQAAASVLRDLEHPNTYGNMESFARIVNDTRNNTTEYLPNGYTIVTEKSSGRFLVYNQFKACVSNGSPDAKGNALLRALHKMNHVNDGSSVKNTLSWGPNGVSQTIENLK